MPGVSLAPVWRSTQGGAGLPRGCACMARSSVCPAPMRRPNPAAAQRLSGTSFSRGLRKWFRKFPRVSSLCVAVTSTPTLVLGLMAAANGKALTLSPRPLLQSLVILSLGVCPTASLTWTATLHARGGAHGGTGWPRSGMRTMSLCPALLSSATTGGSCGQLTFLDVTTGARWCAFVCPRALVVGAQPWQGQWLRRGPSRCRAGILSLASTAVSRGRTKFGGTRPGGPLLQQRRREQSTRARLRSRWARETFKTSRPSLLTATPCAGLGIAWLGFVAVLPRRCAAVNLALAIVLVQSRTGQPSCGAGHS
mmetsp:Transcript_73708/g.208754  ORF Transcript_73708/g.208754 Transcript_73708/m.208754 type:complete len:309 (+) Transcript_73708:876-1802(+)